MKVISAWGIQTSLLGEVLLWEAWNRLLLHMPPATARQVEILLTEPDFRLALEDSHYRFWSLARLTYNKNAAISFKAIFNALPQKEFEFLFCTSPSGS